MPYAVILVLINASEICVFSWSQPKAKISVLSLLFWSLDVCCKLVFPLQVYDMN